MGLLVMADDVRLCGHGKKAGLFTCETLLWKEGLLEAEPLAKDRCSPGRWSCSFQLSLGFSRVGTSRLGIRAPQH